MTPKLWAPLNLTHQGASFDILLSPIGHMVLKILTAGKILEEEEEEQEYNRFIYATDNLQLHLLNLPEYLRWQNIVAESSI